MDCQTYNQNLSKSLPLLRAYDRAVLAVNNQEAVRSGQKLQNLVSEMLGSERFADLKFREIGKVIPFDNTKFDYLTGEQIKHFPGVVSPDGKYLIYVESRHILMTINIATGQWVSSINPYNLRWFLNYHNWDEYLFDITHPWRYKFVDNHTLLVKVVKQTDQEFCRWVAVDISAGGELSPMPSTPVFDNNERPHDLEEPFVADFGEKGWIAASQHHFCSPNEGGSKRPFQKWDKSKNRWGSTKLPGNINTIISNRDASTFFAIGNMNSELFAVKVETGEMEKICAYPVSFCFDKMRDILYFSAYEDKKTVFYSYRDGKIEKITEHPATGQSWGGNFLKLSPDGKYLLSDLNEYPESGFFLIRLLGDGKAGRKIKIRAPYFKVGSVSFDENDNIKILSVRGDLYEIINKEISNNAVKT
ncbi:MAG: hypothetical protein NTW50_05315 [Candidatus Berkelbacteria bacterium]|nr:hypothetical protein [Candidatus Berkelbacteria bacterium]